MARLSLTFSTEMVEIIPQMQKKGSLTWHLCPKARKPVCPKARMPESPHARKPECPEACMPVCPYARMPESPHARKPACPKARMPESPHACMPVCPEAWRLMVKIAPAGLLLTRAGGWSFDLLWVGADSRAGRPFDRSREARLVSGFPTPIEDSAATSFRQSDWRRGSASGSRAASTRLALQLAAAALFTAAGPRLAGSPRFPAFVARIRSTLGLATG